MDGLNLPPGPEPKSTPPPRAHRSVPPWGPLAVMVVLVLSAGCVALNW